jgi:glycosyltransferase involved in cell wall biosynthesis
MKISIVVPAHNEAENLPSLLDSLVQVCVSQKWDYEIIVGDDHSADSTGSIADRYAKGNPLITVIHRSNGLRGMGNTLKDLTKAAKGEIVIWTMGDKSDSIETYPLMVKKINEGYDVVFGARYIKGGSKGDLAAHKAFSSRAYSKIAGFIFGMPVHDITNAFRAFRKKVFDAVELESGDFAISPEFAIKAHRLGFRLGEVPTTYYDRKAGRTSFKMAKMAVKYGSLFKHRFIPVRKPSAHRLPASSSMKLSIVLAAHNEEQNIGILVPALLKNVENILEIIIVNDCSRDKTAEIAEMLKAQSKKVRLVNRMPPPGVGRALKDGFKAVSPEADWVLMMDSDFISNVPDVSVMVAKAQEGYDGVFGSRYVPGGKLVNYPFLKMVSNRAFHLLLRLAFGIRLHDLTNNFKLYRHDVIKSIDFRSNDFAINAETGLFPCLKGYRLAEVPVAWIERSYGKSSFKVFTLAPSYLRVFWRAFTKKI